MEMNWYRPGGRTEGNQGGPLAALILLAGFAGGATLAAALLLPIRRGASMLWWIPMALALGAGRYGYHRLRSKGLAAQMSGTKLLYFGLAALGISGVFVGLCGLFPPLLWLPMVPLGLAAGAMDQGIRGALAGFSEFCRAFPGEERTYRRSFAWGLGLMVLLLFCAVFFTASGRGGRLLLHLLAGLCAPIAAWTGGILLDRRLCLTDQRGAELRRELGKNP